MTLVFGGTYEEARSFAIERFASEDEFYIPSRPSQVLAFRRTTPLILVGTWATSEPAAEMLRVANMKGFPVELGDFSKIKCGIAQ